MDLSIIIINYNNYSDVKNCIESLLRNINDLNYEIIIVDNNSPDRSILKINNDYPFANYIQLEQNYGFGYANNKGMNIAAGNLFLLINPDILVTDDSIIKLYNYVNNGSKNIAVAGPVHFLPNGVHEFYYSFFPGIYYNLARDFWYSPNDPFLKIRINNFWEHNLFINEPFKVDTVMGSCMIVKKEIYELTKGFDEAYFLYDEELDWQYRIKKLGYYSVVIPEASVIHNHHSSTKKMGWLFIYFHLWRSRIIYNNKNNPQLLRILFSISTFLSLLLKIIYNYVLAIFKKNDIKNKKINMFKKLFIFNCRSRKYIINNKFDFSLYRNYFY